MADMLRHFAGDHVYDNYHDLFLSTAVALEGRAQFIATTKYPDRLERDTTIHAPVNMLV